MNYTELLREILKEDFNVNDEWILERFTIETHPHLLMIVIDPIGSVASIGKKNDPFVLRTSICNRLIHFKENMRNKSFEQIISEAILNDRPTGFDELRPWLDSHQHAGNLGLPITRLPSY